jgi:hypothetical protein
MQSRLSLEASLHQSSAGTSSFIELTLVHSMWHLERKRWCKQDAAVVGRLRTTPSLFRHIYFIKADDLASIWLAWVPL